MLGELKSLTAYDGRTWPVPKQDASSSLRAGGTQAREWGLLSGSWPWKEGLPRSSWNCGENTSTVSAVIWKEERGTKCPDLPFRLPPGHPPMPPIQRTFLMSAGKRAGERYFSAVSPSQYVWSRAGRTENSFESKELMTSSNCCHYSQWGMHNSTQWLFWPHTFSNELMSIMITKCSLHRMPGAGVSLRAKRALFLIFSVQKHEVPFSAVTGLNCGTETTRSKWPRSIIGIIMAPLITLKSPGKNSPLSLTPWLGSSLNTGETRAQSFPPQCRRNGARRGAGNANVVLHRTRRLGAVGLRKDVREVRWCC